MDFRALLVFLRKLVVSSFVPRFVFSIEIVAPAVEGGEARVQREILTL